MSNVLEHLDVAGLSVAILLDEDAPSPRDGDNLGILCLFHRRYSLPQEQEGLSADNYSSWEEMEEALLEDYGALVLRPVYGYDHSGLFISTQREPTWYHYAWDGGQLGFIFTTAERMKLLGVPLAGEPGVPTLGQADDILVAEVADYNAWSNGAAYLYEILDDDGELLDSGDGYLDFDTCRREAAEAAEAIAKECAQ